MVYLKFKKYRQVNVAKMPSSKLSPTYFGPFKILQRIISVAYRLELPEGALVHPVFHVSCLKKHVGPTETMTATLSLIDTQGAILVEPKRILDRRMRKVKNWALVELLITWKGEAEENSTWVPID